MAEHEFVIAIDGPAASGKSSTARMVAERLGMHHADSGALYRAATLARTGRSGTPESWNPGSVLHEAARVTLVRRDTSFEILLSGKPVSEELHEPAITALVSMVAKMEPVREWVNELMRSCATEGPIVVDGRDMGTAVFPGAQGGPLVHVIAAKAVCFLEALSEDFRVYQRQVLAKAGVRALRARGGLHNLNRQVRAAGQRDGEAEVGGIEHLLRGGQHRQRFRIAALGGLDQRQLQSHLRLTVH